MLVGTDDMSSWSTTASSTPEREAFQALLAEYFQRPFPSRAAALPTPVPSQSLAASLQGKADAAVETHSTALASSALKNERLMASTGLPPSLIKLGAKHSDVLAPHLARAGVAQAKKEYGLATGQDPKARGPAPPSGLTSGKSFGGINMSSGKDVRPFPSLLRNDRSISSRADRWIVPQVGL